MCSSELTRALVQPALASSAPQVASLCFLHVHAIVLVYQLKYTTLVFHWEQIDFSVVGHFRVVSRCILKGTSKTPLILYSISYVSILVGPES